MVVRFNRPKATSRARAQAFAIALAVALGGCSVMEKADVFDWFGSDDKPPDQANKPLSADEPYPNLADVPGRPARPPAIDRDKIAQSLVADRENAQYTEDVLRRAPDAPPPLASTSPAPAPVPSAPPAVAPLPAPAPVASAPLPPVPSAPPAPVASAPPALVPSAPPAPVASVPPPPPPSPPAAPVVAAPPASAYVPPAQAPLDPNAPPIAMVNNRPVVSAGFYGTEPPPSPPTPPASPTPPAAATFGPLQHVTVPPPPAVSTTALPDVKPGPVAVARAGNVAVRATEPAAAPPPPAPTEVAQIPNAGASAPYQPYQPAPYQPGTPAPMPQVAALPPAGASTGMPVPTPSGTSPDQLDRALRQTFPDTASQGVDALAATIYFGEGAAGLTEDDRAILREVARLHRERGGTMRVVGYASPEANGGDVMARRLANLEVSTRRADAVSRELARFGVPAGAITTSAGGAPTVPGTAGASFGAAGQRRVDIYLDY
jgi:outer membrane protein OmpA-like peptidoglycan-associated protein